MRIPGLHRLILLLRRSPETEYERIMLRHRLRSRRTLIAVGVLALMVATSAGISFKRHVDIELDCLALTVYFEARGEPREGQAAVAHVVMNRIADDRFPSEVCAVVQQGGTRADNCQFTWWCDGRGDHPSHNADWRAASKVARSAYWGLSEDPTGGALWYHAIRVKPIWRLKLVRGPTIGRHVFYRDNTG